MERGKTIRVLGTMYTVCMKAGGQGAPHQEQIRVKAQGCE